MTENEEFAMSDKQTYDMIQKLDAKLEKKTDKITDTLNLLVQDVRKNNHIKDEVEKLHLKLDENTKQINCNTNSISNIETQDETEKETTTNWREWIAWVAAILLALEKMGVFVSG